MIDKKIQDFKTLAEAFGYYDKKNKLQKLNDESIREGFWENSAKAQDVVKEKASLESQLDSWHKLESLLDSYKDLEEINDGSLDEDLQSMLDKVEKLEEKVKYLATFSGEYDDSNCLLQITAGAGGKDAQDFAMMLQKMYLKYFDSQDGYSAKILSETSDPEGGLKATLLEVSGALAYGKLRRDHGVHRLVRLSPFNSGNTRETSFAMVQASPVIAHEEIALDESDVRVDTYRASGNGGQSVNTTDSAVRLTHIPTGLSVSMQNEKSQIQNKASAMKVLLSRLVQLKEEQQKDELSEIVGPNKEAAWGNQIRNYVMHPYKLVKDTRSGKETSAVEDVLNGNLELIW